jgi:Tfp pilus assembly protein PilF
MANYNLACTQARVNLPDEALDALTRAVRLNRDLRAKVASDADLASLRHDRRLATLLAFEEGARQ